MAHDAAARQSAESFGAQFSRDYREMLWQGRPVGVCERMSRKSMMKILRNWMLADRKDRAGNDRRLLGEGRQKADLLAKASSTPQGGVAFVGSSTFTFWRRLREDFPGLPVYNAAFGGSQSHHLLDEDLFERLVLRYRPRQVVYFCGTNDVALGYSAKHVLDGVSTFYRRVRDKLGSAVHVVVLAITKTPFFLDWNEPVARADEANALVASFCASAGDEHLVFVDHTSQPWTRDPEFFVGDNHHMNDVGHSTLAALLQPHLASGAASKL